MRSEAIGYCKFTLHWFAQLSVGLILKRHLMAVVNTCAIKKALFILKYAF